ncbi:hypothetical protein D3C72_1166290 [compost metagenome]
MRQQYRVDVGSLYASQRKIDFQLAAPLLESPCTRINQDCAATAAHQIAVDMDGGGIAHTCVLLQF